MTAAEKVGKMRDEELYSLFLSDQFYDDQEMALAAAQEVENREAFRCGRQPITIRFDVLSKDTLGECGDKSITLSSSFLTRDITGSRTPAMLLSVIFHEGRHDWQHMILANPSDEVPPDMYYSLLADNTCYISPNYSFFATPLGTGDPAFEIYAQYAVQENEMDARYYALTRMREIAKMIPDNDALETVIMKLMESETELIRRICSDFTEEMLEKLEMTRESYFRMRRNDKLPEGYEYFRNFHVILKAIKPLVERIDEQEMKGVLIDRSAAIFTLYAASREAELEGVRIETPEQLVSYAMDHDFKLEQFGLEKNVFRNEIGRLKI